MCRKNVEFLNVKPGGTQSRKWALYFKSTTKNYIMALVPPTFKCSFGDKMIVKTGTQKM
jgi:hypothetical protein